MVGIQDDSPNGILCYLRDLPKTSVSSLQAVTGLPDPMKNHAVVMVRFATECLIRMHDVVKQLEGSLGPGTGSLTARGKHHFRLSIPCIKIVGSAQSSPFAL